MRILHVASAYPDPIAAETPASSGLLQLVPEIEHAVYSFKRADWRPGIFAIPFDDAAGTGHRAIVYGAPPKGVFRARSLDRLADWIAEDASRRGLRPDLIHAHKLSLDALVGERLAARLGAPLMISLQGNSDTKIVAGKLDLRPRYRRIWAEAAVLFPFAPWALTRLEAMLGPRRCPARALPCPTTADAPMAPRIVGPLFRTAFNLPFARLKNIDGLARAVARAARTVPDIGLEVVGGGSAPGFMRTARMVERVAPGRVRLRGAAANGEVQGLFNASCAFALPSHRESFGMVFAEALLAGAPCLFSRGRAIDGYLEEGGVVLAADPADDAEIAAALVRLAREEGAFKERLARLMETGGLDFLRREAIAAQYRAGIAEALAAAPPPPTAGRPDPDPGAEPESDAESDAESGARSDVPRDTEASS